MIRKKKKYSKPRRMYEKGRIEEENLLVKKYALKNKREIWKTIAKVDYYRRRAKDLAKAPLEEQEVFFGKLQALGLKINSTADVLNLKVEDLLNRRLSTVIVEKKLATKTKQARQLIIHKKVLIDGKIINSPSYLVSVEEEKSIKIKQMAKAHKPKEKPTEEVAETESVEENQESEEESEE